MQSNIKDMEKTPIRPIKIDNGLLQLIERYPPSRNRYIKGTMNRLADRPESERYDRSQIYRVVNNVVALNDDNRVIKDAFLEFYKEICPETVVA